MPLSSVCIIYEFDTMNTVKYIRRPFAATKVINHYISQTHSHGCLGHWPTSIGEYHVRSPASEKKLVCCLVDTDYVSL